MVDQNVTTTYPIYPYVVNNNEIVTVLGPNGTTAKVEKSSLDVDPSMRNWIKHLPNVDYGDDIYCNKKRNSHGNLVNRCTVTDGGNGQPYSYWGDIYPLGFAYDRYEGDDHGVPHPFDPPERSWRY